MFQQRSVATVIILSLVTCGIYAMYWYYVTMRDLNAYLGVSDMDSMIELLLVLFTCGIYGIYWQYKYAKRAGDAHAKAGLGVKDDAVICLILSIFGLSIVSMAIIQTTVNEAYATVK